MDWKKRIAEFLAHTAKPLIVILGPTASGKTSLSIDVAKQCGNAEIINADSRQLYRGLDIGTAKITKSEMEGIDHHLLSVLDPDTEVTIAWYKEESEKVIADIHKRKAVPMLVGGSMLYISSVIDGLSPSVLGNEILRGTLGIIYDQDGGKQLHKRLTEIDPESAVAIPRENKVYLIRALEIFELTGKTKSASLQKEECPYDLLIVGIERPREELYKRINERIECMMKNGWVNEVKSLMKNGYDEYAPAMKSHGYKEIMEWIRDGEQSEKFPELIAAIAKRSRNYAKRQMTWWRRDVRIHWI